MLVSVKDCAHILECTPQHIRRMIASGKLEAVNIGLGSRKIWRIKMEEENEKSKEI